MGRKWALWRNLWVNLRCYGFMASRGRVVVLVLPPRLPAGRVTPVASLGVMPLPSRTLGAGSYSRRDPFLSIGHS
jgi:hypothetical protein